MKIRTPVILTVLSLFFLVPLKWFSTLEYFGEPVSFAVSNNMFLAILGAAGAVIVFCSAVARGARIRVNTKKNRIMSLIMFAASAALVFEAVIAYMSYTVVGGSAAVGMPLDSIETAQSLFLIEFNVNLPLYLLSGAMFYGTKFGIYYCIASIVGALGFLLMSYDFFYGKNFFRSKPLLAVLPTVWGVVRIVFSYMVYTSVADLTPCLLDILFMCSALIFLFAQARLFADVNAEKSVKTAVSAGLLSIILCICSNGVRYGMAMSGFGEYVNNFNQIKFIDIIISIMIAAYILYIIAPRAHKSVDNADDGITRSAVIIPRSERTRHVSQNPRLFLHYEEQEPAEPVYHDDAPQSANFVKAVQEDYYYGDTDNQYDGMFLPVGMNTRGTRKMNVQPARKRQVYKLKKTSPFTPNVRINTRLR